MRKYDELTKNRQLVRCYKRLCATTLLVVTDDKENRVLDRQREITHRKAREADTDLHIFSLVFSYISRMWLFGVRFSRLRGWYVTPHRAHPKLMQLFSVCLHISAVSVKLTFISCFLSRVTISGSFVWFSVSKLGVCCYHDLDVSNLLFTFLFLSPVPSCLSLSLSISLSLSLFSLSLSSAAFNLFLTYFPTFSLSSGWLLNLARKLFTAEIINRNPITGIFSLCRGYYKSILIPTIKVISDS